MLADPDFKRVKAVRDWLTHSRLPRTLIESPGTRQRIKLNADGDRIDVRELIEMSRDLANSYVKKLIDLMP